MVVSALRRSRAVFVIVVAVVGATSTTALASTQEPPGPRPAYQAALKDAVTADNPPRAFTQPAGGCATATPCYLPDANPEPSAGLPVDSYTADVYERPTLPGEEAERLLGAIDIESHQVGSDDAWFYFRINIAGAIEPINGLLPSYGFELDFDDDPAGEILVLVGGKAGLLEQRFSADGVSAYWNRNSNILGANAQAPDGPGGTPDGYEVVAVIDGENRVDKHPGGARPLLARVVADDNAVELAISRSFLQATKLNERGVDVSGEVNKIGLRPAASAKAVDPAAFSAHDRFGRRESGSPFPFLQVAPPDPASCPERDSEQSADLLDALDSGTDDDTGIPNPCYPAAAIAAYDNAYYVSTTFSPPLDQAQQEPPRVDDASAGPNGPGGGIFLPVLVLVLTAMGGVGAVVLITRKRRPRLQSHAEELPASN